MVWPVEPAEPGVNGEMDADPLPGNGGSMFAYLPALLNASRVRFEVDGEFVEMVLEFGIQCKNGIIIWLGGVE
jgi:hypothetical protein